MRRAASSAAVIVAMHALALVAMCDDSPDQTFESVYGKEVRKAQGTSAVTDDIALAKQILQAANELKGQDALKAFMLTKVYDLANRYADGYETAIDAMETLGTVQTDRRETCAQKILEICYKQYASAAADKKRSAAKAVVRGAVMLSDYRADAGDFAGAIKYATQARNVAQEAKLALSASKADATIRDLAYQQRVAQQIEMYKNAVKINAKDVTSRQKLVLLYVVEMNDPESAKAYLSEDLSETLRTYVPLAAQPLDKLADVVLLEMGDWYRSLSASCVVEAKPAMLKRAKEYYDAYLQKHTQADADRAKAELAVKWIDSELAKLAPKAETLTDDEPTVAVEPTPAQTESDTSTSRTSWRNWRSSTRSGGRGGR